MNQYYYARPGIGIKGDSSRFTDDVAVTWAMNKQQAYANFKKLYVNVTLRDVWEVKYNKYGVAILTEY